MNDAEAEQLRQEREAFDLNKRHAGEWFSLRLRMGYAGLGMMIVLAAACIFIVLKPAAYSQGVVAGAGSVLAGDVIALLAATWKLVLSPASAMPLNPVSHKERAEP
jgi:hypothetical protein